MDKDVGVNLQRWTLIANSCIGATNLGGDSKGDDSHIEAGKVLILEEKGFYFLLSMIYKMMTLTLPERPQSTSHRAGAAPLKYEVGRILPFYHYLAGHKFTVSYHQGFQMTKHDFLHTSLAFSLLNWSPSSSSLICSNQKGFISLES